MLTCLRELGKRSKFPSLLHQRAIHALAHRRTRRRVPIASSRSRQSQRRAETKSVIEALILGGLEQALNFDARCAERQMLGSARLLGRKQLVWRAAKIRWSSKRTNVADLARSLIPFWKVPVLGRPIAALLVVTLELTQEATLAASRPTG